MPSPHQKKTHTLDSPPLQLLDPKTTLSGGNMAETIFTASCTTTKLDLNQVSPWDDKNGDQARSKDEFTYEGRGFSDEEWMCYEKLLTKTANRVAAPAYTLNIPRSFLDSAKKSLQGLLAPYSNQFDTGTLHVSLLRVPTTSSAYGNGVYYRVSLTAFQNGKLINKSVETKSHFYFPYTEADKLDSYVLPGQDIETIYAVEKLLQELSFEKS